MVLLPTQLRVFDGAVFLIAFFDIAEQGSFGHGVVGAELHRTLEHQVLQIVSQSGGFGRIVLATCSDGDVGLDAWFLLIDRQIHFQTVVEGIDTRLHQVARYGLILIILR